MPITDYNIPLGSERYSNGSVENDKLNSTYNSNLPCFSKKARKTDNNSVIRETNISGLTGSALPSITNPVSRGNNKTRGLVTRSLISNDGLGLVNFSGEKYGENYYFQG